MAARCEKGAVCWTAKIYGRHLFFLRGFKDVKEFLERFEVWPVLRRALEIVNLLFNP